MVCIYCGHKTSVTNSRSSAKSTSTWRRRACKSCRAIFTTHELIDLESSLRVSTSSGALEPFLRDKLLISVFSSLSHRKTALMDSKHLTDTLLTMVVDHSNRGVITSKEIHNIIYKTLNHFDSVSAIHYKAHHP